MEAPVRIGGAIRIGAPGIIQCNARAEGRFRAVHRLTESQPPTAAPPADQHLRMAEAIVISMKGATAAKKQKKVKFANHNKMKILAACGLHEGEQDQVPPTNNKITKDGRTCSAIRDAMELECRCKTVWCSC